MIDYNDFCDINTTKEERKRLNIGDIYSNGLKCLSCGDYIRSKNKHDMAMCKCGKCTIDGGSWYIKVSTEDNSPYELLTIMFNDVDDIEDDN